MAEQVQQDRVREREKDGEIGRGREDMFRQRGHTPVAVIEVWAN